jgi:hypothetical protein
MLKQPKIGFESTQLYNSVHSEAKNEQYPPNSAILLESLKTLEQQLQSRKIVAFGNENSNFSHPLWFSAETERNIWLWRSGYSLADINDFEFWVDIKKLIQKRLELLSKENLNNPFVNPLWGIQALDISSSTNERNYLECFAGILSSIEDHLNVLSQITSEIMRKTYANHCQRRVVVLPSIKK